MDLSKPDARTFLKSIALTALHAVNGSLMYSTLHGGKGIGSTWYFMQDVISCLLLATADVFPSAYVAICM